MLRRVPPVAALLVPFLGAGLACERAPDRPVARLSVAPAEASLVHPGSTDFELVWEPRTPLGEVDGDLRVFVHLLDADGEIVRTFDHGYPHDWVVGRERRHRLEVYQSALGPPLPAGDYALTVGLYDGAGRRWPLSTVGEEVARREYRVATVRTSGDGAPAPGFTFVGGWLPLEPGGDRQILGRRWATGAAAIEVGGGPAGGEIVMAFDVPRSPPGAEWRLMEGETEPRLRVVSDCDGSEHLLAGSGRHELVVGMAASDGCRVTVEPRFQIAWPQGPPRSVALENLYWRSPAED